MELCCKIFLSFPIAGIEPRVSDCWGIGARYGDLQAADVNWSKAVGSTEGIDPPDKLVPDEFFKASEEITLGSPLELLVVARSKGLVIAFSALLEMIESAIGVP